MISNIHSSKDKEKKIKGKKTTQLVVTTSESIKLDKSHKCQITESPGKWDECVDYNFIPAFCMYTVIFFKFKNCG